MIDVAASLCYCKGKGDALHRSIYRGIKLLEHVIKVMERVIAQLIRNRIRFDDMLFDLVQGISTNDAILTVRQLQEKHLTRNKLLQLAFVDLKKAIDKVPCFVIW